ncbi:MAG: hypothetical protein ACM31O_12790 [Bacteroidota bacterium]
MTYFDAASAWRAFKRHAATTVIVLLSAGLAGCETGGSLFGGSLASNETPAVEQAPAPAAPVAKIALAPVIGAPDQVSKQLVSQLTSAIEKQRISVAPDRDAKADYMLRGYIVAARDKASTKVSYIWDVTDPSGKRVNRITGEEVLATVNPKDPWASVTPTVTQNIADKTASSLGSWIPNQSAAVASSSGSSAAPAAVGAPHNQAPVQSASGSNENSAGTSAPPTRSASSSTAATATTASIQRSNEVATAAPVVTGAPGDGNSALATALQNELSRQGVSLAERAGASYRIEGKVTVGAAKEGKQAIQIDWRVKDPQGKSLGTVSQKNEIPQGSLDGEWGKTADAAASAAAQGIIKLLPQPRSTN